MDVCPYWQNFDVTSTVGLVFIQYSSQCLCGVGHPSKQDILVCLDPSSAVDYLAITCCIYMKDFISPWLSGGLC